MKRAHTRVLAAALAMALGAGAAAGTARIALAAASPPGSWAPGLDTSAHIRSAIVYRDTLIAIEAPATNGVQLRSIACWNGHAWQPLDIVHRLPGGTLERGGPMTVWRGTLLLAGVRWSAAASQDPTLLQYDGHWRRFPSRPSYAVQSHSALATLGDQLFLAGRFRDARDEPSEAVVRWTGGGWEPMGLQLSEAHSPPWLIAHDGGLIAGTGWLEQTRNADYLRVDKRRNRLWRWDRSRWSIVKDDAGGNPMAAVSEAGALYVAFAFLDTAVQATQVIGWTGGEWRPVGAALQYGRASAVVPRALAFHDGHLVVAGAFNQSDGHRCESVAFLDGGRWRPLGGGLREGSFSAQSLLSSHGSLWCAGQPFGGESPPPGRYLRWDGPVDLDGPLAPLVPARALPALATPVRATQAPTSSTRPASPFPEFGNGDFRDWVDGVPLRWDSDACGVPMLPPPRPSAIGSPQRPPVRRAVGAEPLAGGGVRLVADPARRRSSRLAQPFPVVPGTYYELQALVRVTGAGVGEQKPGALLGLSIDGAHTSASIEPGAFRWQHLGMFAGERASQGCVSIWLVDERASLEVQEVRVERADWNTGTIFEALVLEFERFYANPVLTPAGWDSLVTFYRPIAARAVNQEAFWNIVTELLSKLRDSRISLGRSHGDVVGASATSNGWVSERHRYVEWNGSERSIRRELVDARSDGGATWGRLRSGAMYLGLPAVVEGRIALPNPLLDELSAADGLLLDLRRMGPAYGSEAPDDSALAWCLRFAGQWAAEEQTYALASSDAAGRFGYKGTGEPRSVTPSGDRSAGRPVVCLIGPRTGGLGAELALMLRAIPNVTLVGQTTRGPTRGTRRVYLPNGWRLDFPVYTLAWPDGAKFDDAHGVTPDVVVRWRLWGDPTFGRGVSLLQRKVSEGKRADGRLLEDRPAAAHFPSKGNPCPRRQRPDPGVRALASWGHRGRGRDVRGPA